MLFFKFGNLRRIGGMQVRQHFVLNVLLEALYEFLPRRFIVRRFGKHGMTFLLKSIQHLKSPLLRFIAKHAIHLHGLIVIESTRFRIGFLKALPGGARFKQCPVCPFYPL